MIVIVQLIVNDNDLARRAVVETSHVLLTRKIASQPNRVSIIIVENVFKRTATAFPWTLGAACHFMRTALICYRTETVSATIL